MSRQIQQIYWTNLNQLTFSSKTSNSTKFVLKMQLNHHKVAACADLSPKLVILSLSAHPQLVACCGLNSLSWSEGLGHGWPCLVAENEWGGILVLQVYGSLIVSFLEHGKIFHWYGMQSYKYYWIFNGNINLITQESQLPSLQFIQVCCS